jgi:2-polyprenyl-3-methyl-5-hydroxy-6-metoxy-1,4-benzoquinol methylase
LINKKNITFKDRIYFSIRGIDNRILDLVMYKNNKHKNFQNVLDVGCGSGFFTKWLIKYLKISKNNIRGIDIFPEVKKFGKTMGVKMECTTLQKYPESGFDLITLNYVLEHEPKPKMMIEQIYNKLSKNGIFYLSVPNSRSLSALIFGKKWICHSVPRHIYNFSKDSVFKMTKNLFSLEYYSTGQYYSFILNRYYKSKVFRIMFSNKYVSRSLDVLFFLFNIGDNTMCR